MSTDYFMCQRPDAGKAFLCVNDVQVLLDLYTTGLPEHKSQSNTRSLVILAESGLIKAKKMTFEVTDKGRAVVERILLLSID